MCIFSSNVQAQISLDCLEMNVDSLYRVSLDTKIPLDLILGKWISNDSLEDEIKFVEEESLVNILPKTHVNPYSFQKDSISIIASGFALNWPPYYCIINLIDERILEIKYFSFGSQKTYFRIYKKEM